MNVICPLCSHISIAYFTDKRRDYRQCQQCALVFVPEHLRLDVEAEKSEYDLHENDPNDVGYQQFLSRLVNPLLGYLSPDAVGLDFGCGPGPAVQSMLAAHGIKLVNYDPIYAPNDQYINNSASYDFITMTEVIEHIYYPDKVLNQLWGLLDEGGVLAIMTKLVIDKSAFSAWHYKNDPTHVCFYSQDTFHYLANYLKAKLVFIDKDVIFLFKSSK